MNNPNTEPARPGRPWLWIVAFFGVLMAFWTVMVTLAVKHLPANVPLVKVATPADADH